MVGSTLTVSPKAVEALTAIILKHLAPLEAELKDYKQLLSDTLMSDMPGFERLHAQLVEANKERDEARRENEVNLKRADEWGHKYANKILENNQLTTENQQLKAR